MITQEFRDMNRLCLQDILLRPSGLSFMRLYAKRTISFSITVKNRIRRLIEMDWDYVFEGMGTEEYNVFSLNGKCKGSTYDLKVMWAHTELLIATMTILEYTGEVWAKEWYERGRNTVMKTFTDKNAECGARRSTGHGKNKQRPGISIYRKDNFHQIRYLMMNLQSIERMIKNGGKINSL